MPPVARVVHPLEPQPSLPVRVVDRDVHLVGRRDEPLGRIGGDREVLAVPEAVPLVPAVARDGQQAVPVRPPRREPARHPADVALRVRVDLVERGRAPALEGLLEGGEVPGAQVVDRAEVRRHPGLEPGRAHRVGAPLLPVHVDDRAVAREGEVDRRRRRPPHLDLLVDHPERLEAVAVAVAGRVGRVELVDVQVLLVDGEDGEAEGDGPVVADGDAGQRRLAGADDVEARRREVDEVAQRRHRVGAVRVVGHDGAAGGRSGRRDHPAVAPLHVVRQRRGGQQRERARGLRGGGPECRAVHHDVSCGQREDLEDVLRQAGIEPLRHLGLPAPDAGRHAARRPSRPPCTRSWRGPPRW